MRLLTPSARARFAPGVLVIISLEQVSTLHDPSASTLLHIPDDRPCWLRQLQTHGILARLISASVIAMLPRWLIGKHDSIISYVIKPDDNGITNFITGPRPHQEDNNSGGPCASGPIAFFDQLGWPWRGNASKRVRTGGHIKCRLCMV